MNFPSKCLNLHCQHTRRQSPKQAHPIPPVEYWMRLMHPSSLAAGTAGQSTRCGMNDAETDPCFCKCCSLRLRNRMSQGFWQRLGKQSFTRSPPPLPFPSLGARAGSSHKSKGQVEGTLILAAAPADTRTSGYLFWIYCLHVTFMSRDSCVCWDFHW